MNYHIAFVLNEFSDGSGKPSEYAAAASISELPNAYIHFAHHDFDIAWNERARRQEVVRGVNKFFGGMGEGSSFDTWQRALLSSLYDLYQVTEGLHEGDTFEATYRGVTEVFRCVGVHVELIERTLLEACFIAKLPAPISEDDLDATFAKLDELGISHNLLGEPCYRLSKERRAGGVA